MKAELLSDGAGVSRHHPRLTLGEGPRPALVDMGNVLPTTRCAHG